MSVMQPMTFLNSTTRAKSEVSFARDQHKFRGRFVLIVLLLLIPLTFVLSIGLGSVGIPVMDVVSILLGMEHASPSWVIIVNDVRVPRAITAALAGASLGVAGLQMQTLLRNPLADPFVLGVSSGASLGVALVVLASGSALGAVFGGGAGFALDSTIAMASILGALLVVGPTLAISARISNPATILIMGLMFGYAISAFVTILIASATPDQLQRWITWGFGSFGGVSWNKLAIFAPIAGIGLIVAMMTTKPLNALLLGENYARSMGLNVKLMRVCTMISASMLAGIVTAFCGPIAFLGIAIPHIARGLLGTSDHRYLVPGVIMLGVFLAQVAQIISLLPGQQTILPLNAVTSMIGAPVVIFIILKSRKGAFTA